MDRVLEQGNMEMKDFGSRLLERKSFMAVLPYTVMSIMISLLVVFNTTLSGLLIGACLIVLCLIRIRSAVWLFLFLSPFTLVIKEIYPSIVLDLWRELYLVCLISAWTILVLCRRITLPFRNGTSALIVGYILWGIVEIFNSQNWLLGIAGFRFMYAFVPIYFIVLSLIRNEKDIQRYLDAVLSSGFIIALLAVVQFIAVNTGILARGTFIDFARKYSPGGITAPSGIGFERAISIVQSPHELGNLVMVCLIVLFALYTYNREYKQKRYVKIVVLAVVMFAALFLSMSRSSMISLICAVAFMSMVSGKMKSVLRMLVLAMLVAVVLPFSLKFLFIPIIERSDGFFTVTVAAAKTSYLRSMLEKPFAGWGFSITPTAAMKLGLKNSGYVSIAATDIHFAKVLLQMGLIGFGLFITLWLTFMKQAYAVTRKGISTGYRTTGLMLLGAFIAFFVTAFHTSPWEYPSLAMTYYVLGAIATHLYYRGISRVKE